MKRLTGWDKGEPYCIRCFEDGECVYMETDKCDTCEHHIAIYRKLAEYEDAGFEPSEIEREFNKGRWDEAMLEKVDDTKKTKAEDGCGYCNHLEYMKLYEGKKPNYCKMCGRKLVEG